MVEPVKNFVLVEVEGGYNASDTEIELKSGEISRMPDPTTFGEYNLVWWNESLYPNPSLDPNREIVRVTAINDPHANYITVVRPAAGNNYNEEGSENTASTKNETGRTYRMMMANTKRSEDEKVKAGSAISSNCVPRGADGNREIKDSKICVDDDGNVIPDGDNLQELGKYEEGVEEKVFKDAHFKDDNGVHFTARQLAQLHRSYSENAAILPYTVSDAVAASVWTITLTEVQSNGFLAFVLGGKTLFSPNNTMTVNATALAGTDSNPKTVYVYVQNNGSDVPELVASNTNPEGVVDHAMVAQYKAGTVGTSSINLYGKIEDVVEMYKIAANIYRRLYDEGTLYQSGLLPVVTASDVTIGVGTYKEIFNLITTTEKQVSVDGLFFQKNDNSFVEDTDFDFAGEYATGESISVGKYFNVVLGVVLDDGTRICAVVQDGDTEYNNLSEAIADANKLTNVSPKDSLLKKIFVPVCKIIVKREVGGYSIQDQGSGQYYVDLRGDAGSGSGGASSGGNTEDGNTNEDFLVWNSTNSIYEPKTVSEVNAILGVTYTHIVQNETPSGSVNGTNKAFDTANNYISGKIQVFRNGQLQTLTTDYTETDSNTITFVNAPETGDIIRVSYIKDGVSTGDADTLDGLEGAVYARADGWNPITDTLTYASATTFTISGVDKTSFYTKGTKIKVTNGGVTKYYYVVSSSFSTNTTVTVTGESDLANSSITDPYYSYSDNPQGFKRGEDWYRCSVRKTTNQSVGTGAYTTIQLDNESDDPNGDFASYEYTVPVTGRYILNSVVKVLTPEANKRYISQIVNGGSCISHVHSANAEDITLFASSIENLSKGDVLKLQLYNNGTVAQDVAGANTQLSIQFIGI